MGAGFNLNFSWIERIDFFGNNPSQGQLQKMLFHLSPALQSDFLEQGLTTLQLNASCCLVVKLKFLNQAVKIFHIQVFGDLIFPNAPSTL